MIHRIWPIRETPVPIGHAYYIFRYVVLVAALPIPSPRFKRIHRFVMITHQRQKQAGPSMCLQPLTWRVAPQRTQLRRFLPLFQWIRFIRTENILISSRRRRVHICTMSKKSRLLLLYCYHLWSWLRRSARETLNLNRAKHGSVTLSDSWKIATGHRRASSRIL